MTVEVRLQEKDGDRQEPDAGIVELEALEEGAHARVERRRHSVRNS